MAVRSYIFIAFAMSLLFLTRCQKSVPKINTTQVTQHSGKIKSIKRIKYYDPILPFFYGGTDSTSANFMYDTTGLLDSVRMTDGHLYFIEHTLDRVILHDYSPNVFPNTGSVFLLKAGTNLIDSIYKFDNGNIFVIIKIHRDNANNITGIYAMQNNDTLIWMNDFFYSGNNLFSYHYYYPGYDLTAQYNVDVSKNYHTLTNFMDHLGMMALQVSNTFALERLFDVGALGLSMGNTWTNSITSCTINLNAVPSTTTWQYSTFNDSSVVIDNTAGNKGKVDLIMNTYY